MSPTLHLILNILLGIVAVLAALALFSGYVARRVTRAFPPEGRVVEVGGDRIHYVEYGSGTPIVFVHGLAGQLRNFAYLPLARLAQHHRVILVDRPGAGRSTRGAGSQANVSRRRARSPRSSTRYGSTAPCSSAIRSAARSRSRSG